MLNLAQRDAKTEGKDFANASDYLETWDDLDNIMVVIAQKDLRHPATWWHNHPESQYQGSEINCQHMEVVGTELRLEFINLTSLRISNT